MTTARRATATVALACALLATACTDEPDPAPEQDEPLVAPRVIEKAPLWPDALPEAGRYEIRGTSLLGVGAGEDAFAVTDVATGTPRWRLRENDVLPGDGRRLGAGLPSRWPVTIVGDDAEWTVVVPYADAREQGAAGLSGADGHVRWTLPVAPGGAGYHYVAAADENIVVSLVSPEPGFALDRTRIVATGIADRATAWEATGLWPSAVVGDTVLGVRASQPGRPRDRAVPGDSVVVALDAATGTQKWHLGDRYPTSAVYLTLGDVAVVFTGDGDTGFTPHAVVIDASTGEELADLGETGDCVDDGATLIACRRGGADDVRIFDVMARKVLPGATKGPVSGAWHGYFFSEGRVVDRAGHTVIDDLPGRYVEAMSPEYALVAGDGGLTVHRVGT